VSHGKGWSHFDGGERIHYGWIVAGGMFLALLGSAGMRAVLPVYFKPLEADFGWTRAALANVGAASILAYGLTQPFSGRLCDRYGPRLVVTIAMALCGLGAIAMSAVSNFWLFAAASVLLVATGAAGRLKPAGPAPGSASEKCKLARSP
jgi:sugar phosphate permease